MPESHFLRSEVLRLVSRSGAGDQAPPARRLFTPPRGRWLLLISILSAAYTANVIQWSLRFGRLAMDPVFDDVGYLTDGLQRLNILDQAGFHAFCRSFVQAPPHSPWSTLLATSAFAVFGVHDWAPYLLNGLLVFIFLCLAWDIVDHKNTLTRFAISSLVLLLQLPFQAVLEFRPDFAAALFTAAFSVLFLKIGFREMGPGPEVRSCIFVGLLAGLAFLTKPSFFPLTGVMLLASFCLSEVNRIVLSKGRVEMGGILRRGVSAFLSALLLAGPYFIVNWHALAEYLVVNTGSGKEAAIWKVQGGFWVSLAQRLHGYSLSVTLGRFSGLLATWLAIGIVIAALQRNYRAVLFSLSGILLTAISVLIIAAGEMVDPHFSYLWTILFVLVSLHAVGEITKSGKGSWLVALFCFMALFTFYKQTPAKNIWLVTNDTARGRSLNEEIVRRIAEHTTPTGPSPKPAIVYSTFMGKVNAASQNWFAIRDNANISFRDLHRSGDIADHLSAIQEADFVEVADAGSQWLDRWLPSASLQNALLDRLRNLSRFRELPPVLGKEGTVFLFQKKSDR